eukprot:403333754
MTYFQALEFTFKPKSSFYNLESIKIDLRYSEAFLDKYGKGVEAFTISQPSGYSQYLSQTEKDKTETPILISQIFLYALILLSIFSSTLFGSSVESTWALISKDKFENQPYTYQFYLNNYNSMAIFNNMGDLFTIWLLIILLYPVLLYLKLTLDHNSNLKHLTSPYLKSSFGLLFLDFKQSNPIYYMYHWTYLLRRLIFVISLIKDSEDGNTQLWTTIITSGAFIMGWHLVLRPFQNKLTNMIVMLNEMLLSGVCIICLQFVDETFHEDDANQWGYALILLVTSIIILNSILIIPVLCKKTYDRIKLWLDVRDERIRLECEKKYLITGAEKDLFINPLKKNNQKIYITQQEKEEFKQRSNKLHNRNIQGLQSDENEIDLDQSQNHDQNITNFTEDNDNYEQDYHHGSSHSSLLKQQELQNRYKKQENKKITWSRDHIQERAPRTRSQKAIQQFQEND